MKKVRLLAICSFLLMSCILLSSTISAREVYYRRYSTLKTEYLGTSYLTHYGEAYFEGNVYAYGAAINKKYGDASLSYTGHERSGADVIVNGLVNAPNNYTRKVYNTVSPSSSLTRP